jgi:broad specificity phosphatase PhoE/8-oxo-dGTP pyrophosphatase MutT (NUDIX family)
MVMTSEIRAAGGIVWQTGENGVLEIALVHRPKYDDWTLPKGKPHPGETEEETAVREVKEETGLRCVLERPIGRIHYMDRRGRPKTVRFWLMRPISGSFTPSDEVDELRWLSLDQAETILSYEHDRWLLQRFAHLATSMHPGLGHSSLGSVPVYLVRHAKAGNRGEWTKPDHLRPLSENGKQQAEQLVAMLDGSPIERLISSPHVRCVQTLEPLASERGLTLEESEDLAEGAGPARALALLSEVSEKPTVLCSHGDVIEEVLQHLSAEGLELPHPPPLRKGSTWVLETEGDGFVGARYLPPP